MKKIPRSTLIPLLLLIYLAVMAYFGWADYAAGLSSALNYFGVLGVTLTIIVVLHFTIKRQERLRKEREDDMKRNSEK